MIQPSSFVEIQWRSKTLQIEYAWVGECTTLESGPNPPNLTQPVMVFLHEGLGSLSMWRDFPHALCKRAGCRGLVFSRPGYGLSSPRAPDDRWDVDFLHRQALEVLPNLLQMLGVSEPVTLFGHSDGGSIALLFAAFYPHLVHGLIVLAPHLFVESITLVSIEEAGEEYLASGLRERLSKYHADVDSAFYGWLGVWLKPEFKHWNIESEVARIQAPILAIQGLNDPYGTLYQIRRIKELIAQTTLFEIAECAHSPHKEQRALVEQAACEFLDHLKSF
jgi:pimeloyl-ACP methyl ester carboxylesterase